MLFFCPPYIFTIQDQDQDRAVQARIRTGQDRPGQDRPGPGPGRDQDQAGTRTRPGPGPGQDQDQARTRTRPGPARTGTRAGDHAGQVYINPFEISRLWRDGHGQGLALPGNPAKSRTYRLKAR